MMMRGHMMERPLMISDILVHADRCHGRQEIVTRLPESGQFHRYGYRDAHTRSRQLANALTRSLKIKPSDRVSTIAWNSHRHFELYYAVSGIGAIVHTVNPRIDPKQIAWMLDHANSRAVFFDIQFAPLVDAIAKHCKTVKTWVLMTDKSFKDKVKTKCETYEELVGAQSDDYEWPLFDEYAASAL